MYQKEQKNERNLARNDATTNDAAANVESVCTCVFSGSGPAAVLDDDLDDP